MAGRLPDLWRRSDDAPQTFESLHDEIDRVFDQFRRNVEFPSLFHKTRGVSTLAAPKMDVVETEKAIEISAELPGVEEADIDVTANDNVLTIKGEKKIEKTEEKDNVFMSERSYGMFERSVPVGFSIDPKLVQAAFENGVLKVTLPKPPEAKSKAQKIKINGSK